MVIWILFIVAIVTAKSEIILKIRGHFSSLGKMGLKSLKSRRKVVQKARFLTTSQKVGQM
jgi:hypothetical protein